MADKLQRIFEYRVLLSKAQKRQPELDDAQQQRLERLRQLLPLTVPPLDDRDPYTLLPAPLEVEFAQDGRFFSASLRNASGGGLAIATDEPPALGQQLAIHVRDRKNGVVYSFPSRVVSRVLRGVSGMSVAFEGLPIQTRIAVKSSGVWGLAQQEPTDSGPRKQRDSA